ncbi:hypothetical protein KCP70_17895 [Salmonella enterica subsp. enterica]|nr:hypothetical protein KCP70_17895 [Salmonella enterica subsp. enterica]
MKTESGAFPSCNDGLRKTEQLLFIFQNIIYPSALDRLIAASAVFAKEVVTSVDVLVHPVQAGERGPAGNEQILHFSRQGLALIIVNQLRRFLFGKRSK